MNKEEQSAVPICPSCGQLHENWSGTMRSQVFLDLEDGGWQQVTVYALECPETAVPILGNRTTTGSTKDGRSGTRYYLQILEEGEG